MKLYIYKYTLDNLCNASIGIMIDGLNEEDSPNGNLIKYYPESNSIGVLFGTPEEWNSDGIVAEIELSELAELLTKTYGSKA